MKYSRLLFAITLPIFTLALFMVTLQTKASPTATFTVNSTVDAIDANPGDGVCETGVGNGICTLRAAVMEANALSGSDSIVLPSGTFAFSLSGPNEDSSTSGDLDITEDLIITGAGVDNSFIDASKFDRVIHNFSGVLLEISHLTIQNGYISSPGGPGGGISNDGTLIIDNSSIFSNTTYTTPAHGGGIYNSGVLTLTATTISKNLAQFSNGGGIYNSGSLHIENSTVNENIIQISGGYGGSLFNFGSANIINSTFSQNLIMENAGTMNIYSSTFFNENVDGSNGSVMTITHTILDAAASDGSCDGGGTFISGGYNIDDNERCGFNATGDLTNTLSLLGPLADNGGPTKTHAPYIGSKAIDAGSNALCTATDQRGVARPIDGNNDSSTICDIGAFEYDRGIPPTITFFVNSTNDDDDVNPGDKICETAVGNNICTFRAAIQEGNQQITNPIDIILPSGIYSLTNFNLKISHGLNIIGSDPNEVVIIRESPSYVIWTDNPGVLPMSISNTTLRSSSYQIGSTGDTVRHDTGILKISNSNVYDSAPGPSSNGIGVYNFDQLHVIDSTIAFNYINVVNNGDLVIENSTVYSGTLGGIRHDDGTLVVTNSSLIKSGISNFGSHATVQNTILEGCGGNQITSLGNNIDTGSSCNFSSSGDLNDTNPLLGDFVTTYGSATFEVLLNSPTIDAGNNVNCPITDQRGAPRPFDGDDNGTAVCDIGAVEYGSLPLEFIYLPFVTKP